MKVHYMIALGLVAGVIVAVGLFSKNTSGGVSSPTTPVVQGAQAPHTMAEVTAHAAADNCWTAINGKVYNLTPFVQKHPGGVENIIQICGKDGSAAFSDQHGGQRRPEAELQQLYIGDLQS